MKERYRVTNVTEEEDMKNLIKPTDARTKLTEVERAQDALAEAILFGEAQKLHLVHG